MTKEGWDKYWKNSKITLYGRICTFYRYYIIKPYLSKIIEKYFSRKGVFVDCGSGSSETSVGLNKYKRKYIALDISYMALNKARNIDNIPFFVNADILKMPFKKNSIEGLWNLGVMEHFDEEELNIILQEFHRVLKKGSYTIFFWPPVYGSSEIILGALSFFLNKVLRYRFWYTPEEKTRIKSMKHIRDIISKTNFKLYKLHFSIRDMFTYVVVVCQKE